MLAVNYTNLRDNMKSYMDQITDDYETMIVTRKNNKNVKMIRATSTKICEMYKIIKNTY